jgi:hypothetical protein
MRSSASFAGSPTASSPLAHAGTTNYKRKRLMRMATSLSQHHSTHPVRRGTAWRRPTGITCIASDPSLQPTQNYCGHTVPTMPLQGSIGTSQASRRNSKLPSSIYYNLQQTYSDTHETSIMAGQLQVIQPLDHAFFHPAM